jgi:hypothetical protein
MKAKMVKVYQAVYLDRKLGTHFPNGNAPEVSIEFLEGIGVKVSSKTDSIIVPYPNVAYVQLEPEVKQVRAVKGS